MRHLSLPCVLAIACSLTAGITLAQAAQETWVSGTGTDAGACPITGPCGTFDYAYGQTSAGGSINVLSAGNFGPVIITKSISIVADGVEALISTSSGAGPLGIGAGITINGPPSTVVSLRGLTIDLTSARGILFVAGQSLHIHNIVVRRAAGGILFTPASGTPELNISDTYVTNTTSAGIYVAPTGSAGAKVLIDRARVENAVSNGGIAFIGSSTSGEISATVRDSVSSHHNTTAGISIIEVGGGGSTKVMLERVTSVNNATGVFVNGAGATVRLQDSTITGNSNGVLVIGTTTVGSYKNNRINGNASDGATPTAILLK